jgi:hypothetical protein
MSFSYDNTLVDEISQVRFYIQDTVEISADFSDEEISFYLQRYDNDINKTVYDLAFALYVKYSKLADVEHVGKIRLEYNSRAEAMKSLYEGIKKQSVLNSGKPMVYFGGIDRSRYNEVKGDSSLTKPLTKKDGIYYDPCNPDKWDDEEYC